MAHEGFLRHQCLCGRSLIGRSSRTDGRRNHPSPVGWVRRAAGTHHLRGRVHIATSCSMGFRFATNPSYVYWPTGKLVEFDQISAAGDSVLEAVSIRLGEGDSPILLRELRKMGQSPTVLKPLRETVDEAFAQIISDWTVKRN